MAVLYNAINSFIFLRTASTRAFLDSRRPGSGGDHHPLLGRSAGQRLDVSLLTGIGLSALGTYGFSLGNMISMRHQRRGLETMTTNAWAMLYGTLVMGCIALFRGDSFAPQWTMSYMGALVYLALFGSVIAFGAYFTTGRTHWSGQSGLQYPALPAGGAVHLHGL